MKIMKKIPYLLALLVLLSCSRKDPNATVNFPESEDLDEMSIYQLPAVWNTQRGDQIEFKDLQGETLVMVMIYTSCRTACPRLVADMRGIEGAVNAKSSDPVKYILVSIDPKKDTPERLFSFAKENGMEDDQWVFLQGTEESTRDFANILAVKYKEISPMDFSHSNIISVFDKKGVLKYQKEGLGLENQDIVEQIVGIAAAD